MSNDLESIKISETTSETSSESYDEDQNKKQRMSSVSVFAVEFYKILTGCFLLFFVPQECDDHACSMSEIMAKPNPYYKSVLCFNGVTFMCFLFLYGIEIYRENTLIKYLDVNPHKARSNESVKQELEALDKSRLSRIRNNRKIYDNVCKACAVLFVINNVASAVNLYNHQLGSKTASVYITNVLFTATKLGNVFGIVYADENIFYSAYMTRKIQFNDVDRAYENQFKEDTESPQPIDEQDHETSDVVSGDQKL